MSSLALVLAAAVVTFASRAVFLAVPARPPRGAWARFLDVFPLALFVSLATASLAAPDGRVAATPALAAAAGGVLGAALARRSLVVVIGSGAVVYWAVRLLLGG